MIEEFVKIHDQFSIEFKVGFTANIKQEVSDFSMNMWVFIPNALDINKYTYSKTDFYKDFKSNVRLITPIYLLRDIANPEALPLQLLNKSFQKVASQPTATNIADYETQIKMFQSILKSALREETLHIKNCRSIKDREFLINNYLENVTAITSGYRKLKQVIHVHTIEQNVFEYYLFGDEFMSNIVELQTFKLIKSLDDLNDSSFETNKDILLQLVHYEVNYKQENGYLLIEKESKDNNRTVVSRFGALKKYIESHLFLTIKKREDGTIVRQFYYSLAAGISMIFATVIAFAFQFRYGNFTLPLFIALVVAYMLKDRIKELSRFYFAHKLDSRYFDNRTDISLNNSKIGWYKESQSFIKEQQTPQEVIQIRNRSAIMEAENRINDEKIILYRLNMLLNRKDINENNVYPISGVNNIIRFNVYPFIQKMDDAHVPLYIVDEQDNYQIIEGEKIYYLNFIIHFNYLNQSEYKRYRITFNREGIKRLEQME